MSIRTCEIMIKVILFDMNNYLIVFSFSLSRPLVGSSIIKIWGFEKRLTITILCFWPKSIPLLPTKVLVLSLNYDHYIYSKVLKLLNQF